MHAAPSLLNRTLTLNRNSRVLEAQGPYFALSGYPMNLVFDDTAEGKLLQEEMKRVCARFRPECWAIILMRSALMGRPSGFEPEPSVFQTDCDNPNQSALKGKLAREEICA